MATTNSTSTYLENKIINYVLRLGTPPAGLSGSYCWVALYSSNPTDDDTGTELSGSGYAREGPLSTLGWSFSAGMARYNYQIDFPVSTGSWGWVTHIGLKNAPTAGSLLFYGPLVTQASIDNTSSSTSGSVWNNQGEIFSIVPGTLNVALSSVYSNYLSNAILRNLLTATPLASLGVGVFTAFYTTLPSVSDTGGVESVHTGRFPISSTGLWTTPTSGCSVYKSGFGMGTSFEDWGTMVGICLRTGALSSVAGTDNLLFRTYFDNPVPMHTGDSIGVSPCSISLTID